MTYVLFNMIYVLILCSVKNKFFSTGIHLPGFLNWGDVSLAAALSGRNVQFVNPVTMSGRKLSEDKLKEYQAEFDRLRTICKKPGQTLLNYSKSL